MVITYMSLKIYILFFKYMYSNAHFKIIMLINISKIGNEI